MVMKKNVWTAWAVVSMSCCAAARGGGVGFREAGGAHVAAGTQTLSGALTVSPQGEFVKTGAGTLEIPMQSIENGAPYNITAADGKLLTESRTACFPGRNHVE